MHTENGLGMEPETGRARPSDLMTIQEVAAELRCSKAHVYNLVNGRIKGVRPLRVIPMGRRRVVRRSSFETWQRENECVLSGGMLPSSPEVDAVDA